MTYLLYFIGGYILGSTLTQLTTYLIQVELKKYEDKKEDFDTIFLHPNNNIHLN